MSIRSSKIEKPLRLIPWLAAGYLAIHLVSWWLR